MRKIYLSLIAAGAIVLFSGCYDTIQELTLNKDGTGTISYTNDMSALIAMAKQMGGGEQLENAGKGKMDSTISLSQMADSIPGLTAPEKAMVKTGTLHINMDMEAEKFFTKLSFPFSTPAQIASLNQLSGKIMGESTKKQVSAGMGGGDDMPEMTSFDDYYTLSFSKGSLIKALNKEKYAAVADDAFLKGMKETAGMGLALKATYIINLPKPATKVEGKAIRLSEDKKTVTLTADIDDFFTDPSLLEYKIIY